MIQHLFLLALLCFSLPVWAAARNPGDIYSRVMDIPGANARILGKHDTVISSVSQGNATYYRIERATSAIIEGNGGVRSNSTFPVTMGQQVAKAKVGANLLQKAKYARAGGIPGLVIGTLGLMALETLLEDEGYTYDNTTGDYVSGRDVILCAHLSRPCFLDGPPVSYNDSPFNVSLRTHNYPPSEQDKELLCSKIKASNIEAGWDFDFISSVYSAPYCTVKVLIKSGYFAGTYRDLYYQIKYFRFPKDPLTASRFMDIVAPHFAQDPAKWVKSADLEEADFEGKPTVSVLDGTVINSNPYTDTDGRAKQRRWRFYDCVKDGKKQTCVEESVVERPDLRPGSPEAPNIGRGSQTAPGVVVPDGGGGGANQPPPPDLCEKNPDIIACQKMGEPSDDMFDPIAIPTITENISYTPDFFLPQTATCPQPKTFHVAGREVALSYEPICSFLEKIRFAVLAGFIVLSMGIAFGSLRKS